MKRRRSYAKSSGRRTKRARRTFKRRGSVARRARVASMRVVRKFWLQNWVPSSVATADFWKRFTFSLSQVPNASEYVALFDQYRIAAVKLTFVPKYSAFDGANTTDVVLPGVTNQGPTYAHVVNDPYNTVVPSGAYSSATLNAFMELGKCRSRYGTKSFSIYTRPTLQGRNDGVDTNMFKRSCMLPTTSTGISHFGPMVFLQDQNLTGVFGNSYDIFATYYMTFKNAK